MCVACRVCSAVNEFLSEAVVSVARRPHELYESILEAADSLALEFDSSLLAVAALQQAIRVQGSAKKQPALKAAISGYVAGELRAFFQSCRFQIACAKSQCRLTAAV